jgi:hypothetical protein
MSADSETRAEAFRGAVTPEGVVIEFGCLGEPGADGGTAIALTDRVVMPPETAQRLALTLADCLQRSGSAPAPAAASPAGVSRGEIPVNAPPDAAGEKATALMELVGKLGVPFQHERSFRMSEGELFANRFLLTVAREDLGAGRLARVLDICRHLGMPSAVEGDVGEHFDHSRCIHFGFEAGASGVILKLYLEREFTTDDVERARAEARPIPLHLAYKWNLPGPGHVVSRYLWSPSLSMAGIEERLAAVYGAGGQEVSLDIARAVLRLAASRAPAERLQYLEVLEDENDRRSFDLNLYEAKLQVKDVQHLLSRMRAHFGVRPGQFQTIFDQIRMRTLGHIAGGVHRNSRDFFNIYYGVEGYPRFSGVSR